MSDLKTLQIANNHINAYTHIMRRVMFPNESYAEMNITLDSLYKSDSQTHPLYETQDQLKTLSESFIQTGQGVFNTGSNALQKHQFDEFDNILSEILYRLEHQHDPKEIETSDHSSGQVLSDQIIPIDFHDHTAFLKELDAELEKVKRHQYQFTLLLTRPRNGSTLNDEEQKKFFGIVHSTLRPYDDGYLLDDGRTIALCLKYTDTNGGLSAYDRMREEINNHKSDWETDIDLIACLYEPKEYDSNDKLLGDLMHKLADIKPDQDIIVSHEEDSDLLQYLLNKSQ